MVGPSYMPGAIRPVQKTADAPITAPIDPESFRSTEQYS